MKIVEVNIWDKYHFLTIIWEMPVQVSPCWLRYRKMICQCDCWNVCKVRLWDLRKKKWYTGSCGCFVKQNNKLMNTTHWFSYTRLYKIWCGMKIRCENKNDKAYKYYWERGITIDWVNFESFKDDMYKSYINHCNKHWIKYTTIDRTDNNWNYCKKNCKWATPKEQCRNRRNNRIYNWKTIAEWCENIWINRTIVDGRINRWWSVNKSLFTKQWKKQSIIKKKNLKIK